MTPKMTGIEREAHAQRYLKGINFFSVGPCPNCDGCGTEGKEELTNEEYDSANEGGFSWHSCEVCGSTLGGNRYPAHGFVEVNGRDQLCHFQVCTDCLMSFANGEPYADE